MKERKEREKRQDQKTRRKERI